jgi:hypothetical protein
VASTAHLFPFGKGKHLKKLGTRIEIQTNKIPQKQQIALTSLSVTTDGEFHYVFCVVR